VEKGGIPEGKEVGGADEKKTQPAEAFKSEGKTLINLTSTSRDPTDQRFEKKGTWSEEKGENNCV